MASLEDIFNSDEEVGVVSELLSAEKVTFFDGVRPSGYTAGDESIFPDEYSDQYLIRALSRHNRVVDFSLDRKLFMAYRGITNQRARQLRAKFYYPHMLELGFADLVDGMVKTGHRARESQAVGIRNGYLFSCYQKGASLELDRSGTDNRTIGHTLCDCIWRAQNTWSVKLRTDSTRLAVTLETDPVGAREVFRLRDIPDGKTRRTALRHWVKDHWRQRRSGKAVDLVRSHLRGETSFTWGGLECELLPSVADRDAEIARKSSV